MQLLHYKTELETLQHSATTLQKYFEAYADEQVLFLSSGGSAFSLLEYVQEKALSDNLTLSVLDERFSHKPTVSNYIQFSNTSFFKKAKSKGAHTIETIPQMGETLDAFAKRVSFDFATWIKKNENGVIIATMGIGPDGHTAGIMPYPESETTFNDLFMYHDSLFVGYDAQNKNEISERITATIPFLTKNVRHAVMLLNGKDKNSAFERLTSLGGSVSETPARVIHDMNDVKLITTL